jgi:hypothetical protein
MASVLKRKKVLQNSKLKLVAFAVKWQIPSTIC